MGFGKRSIRVGVLKKRLTIGCRRHVKHGEVDARMPGANWILNVSDAASDDSVIAKARFGYTQRLRGEALNAGIGSGGVSRENPFRTPRGN